MAGSSDARRPRSVVIPPLDEDAAHARRRGQAGDDDERRLLARRQVGDSGPAGDDERGDRVHESEAHGAHLDSARCPDRPARR